MKKYIFKKDEKVVEAIKQQRIEARRANYEDERIFRLINHFRGNDLPPQDYILKDVFDWARAENKAEKEKTLRLFRKKTEGMIFKKIGDDYWHIEYYTKIPNGAGEYEIVRVVRHKVTAALASFTAYDIFLGNKRINIDEFDWDEFIAQLHKTT